MSVEAVISTQVIDTTSVGRSVMTAADAAAARTALSLGTLATQNGTLSDYLTSATAATTYQPLDSDLTTIAGLTATTDNFIQSKAGAWASRTVAQVKTDLGLTGTNSGDQTNITGNAGTVTTIAGLISAGTNVTVSGSGTIASPYSIAASGGGGGITSINGNTTAAQLLTVGTAGTNFAIDSTTTPGTSVFNIPDASATARGLITTGTQTFAGTKTLAGDLLFTDAAYDIGKTGATRPRDGWFSRDLSVSGSAYATTYYFQNTNLRISSVAAPYTMLLYTAGGVTCQISSTGTTLLAGSTGSIGFSSSSLGTTTATGDTVLFRDAAGTLAQRNSANAQTFRVYNTYTSSTSFENLQFKANAAAAYQIGSAVGSAGGTNRDLSFGHYDSAGTFTTGLTVNTSGHLVSGYTARLGSDGLLINGAGYVIGFSGTVFGWISGSYITSSSTPEFGWYREASNHVRLKTPAGVNGTLTIGTSVITQPVSTSGSPTALTLTGAAHTTLTLSTEATDVNFNLSRTVQFATGALTTQRAMRIQAPTYGFVGASTITTASTLSISGPPVAGTNATITNAYALNVEGGKSYFSDDIVFASGKVAGGSTTGFGLGTAGAAIPSVKYFGGYAFEFGSGIFCATSALGIGPTVSGYAATGADTLWNRDAAGVFAQRNGTNAQTLRVYNTYTSATSYERLNTRAVASANFEIGPENGSAGGTLRGLTLGGYSAGTTTIAPWLTFTSSGNASFSQCATIQGGVLVEAGGSYTTSYASPAQVRVRRAQGTQASPTQVTTGVQLGIIGAQGLNNIGTYAGYTSYISFNAGENITSTGCGGYFNFYTTPVGSTTEVMRTWLGAAGNFGIGVFAAEPSTLLTINGDMLRLTTAKTPATSTSTANQGEIGWDTSSLYVAPATNTWKRTPVIGFSTGTSCVPAFVVDRYYSGYASQNLSTQAMTANVLTFIPINIPYTFSATRIGINVTTAVAGGARLGIYNDISGSPSGTPLLDAGTVDIGTTGEKEITITQSLVTGLYWLAVVTNSAATLTAENLGTSGVSVPNLGSATGSGNSITHLTQSHTYAALPTVGTLTAATTKTPPRVWLRNVVASATPTFVASSVNKSYPSGIAAGDIIVVYLANGSAPALPSGFTNLGTQTASLSERACYKVASGSETGVISADTIACCMVIRGGSTANIAFSFSATHTVAAANSQVAVLGWSDGDGGPGIDVTAPVGWTRRANTTPASPGSVVLTLDALRAAGSYTHTVSFSGSYSSGQIVFSIG